MMSGIWPEKLVNDDNQGKMTGIVHKGRGDSESTKEMDTGHSYSLSDGYISHFTTFFKSYFSSYSTICALYHVCIYFIYDM